MLNVILAIATALFGIAGRVRHPYVPWLRPDWPDRQQRSRCRDDAIAAARCALDGVDHPLIL